MRQHPEHRLFLMLSYMINGEAWLVMLSSVINGEAWSK